ncbi:hypothetical protein GJ496_002340 [Pomphorhynchus laevis]|nr:hypothetical protein GJ496_002340 [Pomphorhynchus laevis]
MNAKHVNITKRRHITIFATGSNIYGSYSTNLTINLAKLSRCRRHTGSRILLASRRKQRKQKNMKHNQHIIKNIQFTTDSAGIEDRNCTIVSIIVMLIIYCLV